MKRWAGMAAACAASAAVSACGAGAGERLRAELRSGRAEPTVAVVDRHPDARSPSGIAFDVRHRIALGTLHDGSYVPLERASVALDPELGRIFVGTSKGSFQAFAADGTRVFRRSLGAPIEATPLVDSDRDVVYVATAAGKVHAIHETNGEPLWSTDVGESVTATFAISPDTLYVVSDSDVVAAIDRADGTVLWTYRRPPAEELTITGHAGLLIHEGTLVAAFNDGMVAGILATDGSVLWEIDTSVDLPVTSTGLPRMRDVDTTPVVVGDSIFVASFAAGLYELDVNNGSVRHRDETWTGIVSILALPTGDLFLASADRGYARFDPRTRRSIWTRRVERGAPSGAVYVPEQNAIVYGETRGSLIAVGVEDGVEIGRFESGYGFGASPVAAEGVVGALSNTATLFVVVAR